MGVGFTFFEARFSRLRSATKHTCIREVRMKPGWLCALKGKRGGGGGERGKSARSREKHRGRGPKRGGHDDRDLHVNKPR